MDRAARARRALRSAERRARGAGAGLSRPSDGQGRRGNGHVGGRVAAPWPSARPAHRRHPQGYPGRNFLRHPSVARRAGREGWCCPRRGIPEDQDQDQARQGRGVRARRTRGLSRRAPDGRRQQRVHARRHGRAGGDGRPRPHDVRTAAGLGRHRPSRRTAEATQDPHLPRRIDYLARSGAGYGLVRRGAPHQHQAGTRGWVCPVPRHPRLLRVHRNPRLVRRNAGEWNRPRLQCRPRLALEFPQARRPESQRTLLDARHSHPRVDHVSRRYGESAAGSARHRRRDRPRPDR